jgi:hypothetical protein
VESTKIQIKKLPAIETKVLDNSLTWGMHTHS